MSEVDFKGFIKSEEKKFNKIEIDSNPKIGKSERLIYLVVISFLILAFIGTFYYLSTNNYFKSDINQAVSFEPNTTINNDNTYNFTMNPVNYIYNNYTIKNEIKICANQTC